MFNMLRHESSGSGSFVLEPTKAPFDRRRQSNTVRLACIRCRSKKVKCTGEKDGCRRCVENNARCSYSTTTSSRTLSKANVQEDSRSEAPPTARPTSTSPSEDFMSRLTETPIEAAGSEIVGGRPNLSEDPPLIDVNSDLYTGSTPDLDMFLGDTCQSYPLPQRTFSDSGFDFSIPDATVCPSLFADRNSNKEVDAAFDHGQRCSCSDMVRTYEKAEVYLVWAQHDRSGATSIEVDEVLRWQKTVLASCESALNCDLCSLQSEQVMLMISICNKLLASFVQISSTPPLVAHETVRPSMSGQCTPRQEQQSISGRSDVKSRGSKFEFGECNIDDEDKQTLLNARAARLNGLIDRLGEVVTTNRWLVHKNMIRDLLKRFVEHQDLWKP